MLPKSLMDSGRGARAWALLGVLLIGFQFVPFLRAQDPAVPGEGVEKEYVALVPDVEVGAIPKVIARPLKFDEEAGIGEIPLEIVPAGFWKSRTALREVDYDRFEFDLEAPSHLVEVGEPNVPIQVLEVDIPPNAELDEVALKPELLKTLENVNLVPVQESPPIVAPQLLFEKETVTVNVELYKQEAPYPGKFHEVTTVGYFGGRKTVILKAFPVQFSPAAKKASFYKLTGTLKFKAKSIPKRDEDREVLGPAEKALGLSPLTLEDARQWEEHKRTIGSELLEQFKAMGFHARIEKEALSTIPCVIVTADLFYCPARELAAHHTRKGVSTAVVRARAIEKAIGGKDAPDKIRNFIRILHRHYRTRWIILFGDVVSGGSAPYVHVPTRMAVDPDPYGGVDDGWIPCDYYYACLDGTWDANSNGKYGELADKPDLLPEVYVGRIPTNDFDDAYHVVRAIARYENTPPKPKGSLLAANDLGWGCHEITFKEKTVLPLVRRCGWPAVTRQYQKWNNLSVSTFAKAVNGGVDFIEYYGHGSPDATQLMTMAQVHSLLKPTPSYPVVFALSCSTSRYDGQECFGEAWVEGVKASGYVGSTRVAYGLYPHTGEGLDIRFIKNYCALRQTGQALGLAKYQLFKAYGWQPRTVKTVLEFTLFGDPVMKHVK